MYSPICGNQWSPPQLSNKQMEEPQTAVSALLDLISVVYWWQLLDDWLLLYPPQVEHLWFQQKLVSVIHMRDCALYGIERTVMLMTDNLYLLRSPWPFIELDRLAYYPMIIATHHLTLRLGYSEIIPIPTASHCYKWLQGIPPNAGKYIMHHLHPESVLSVMTQTCKYLCTMNSLCLWCI